MGILLFKLRSLFVNCVKGNLQNTSCILLAAFLSVFNFVFNFYGKQQ